MRHVIDISKALSDPSRVRVVRALRGRELCVCQLVELLGLAPSTVSKHMAVLKQADLVDVRKDGRWAYYRRAGRTAPRPVREALRWVDDTLAASPDGRDDAERLRRILAVPLEELCRTGVMEAR